MMNAMRKEFLFTTNGSFNSYTTDQLFAATSIIHYPWLHETTQYKITQQQILLNLKKFVQTRKASVKYNPLYISRHGMHQKYSCRHCAASISDGQYGHLNVLEWFFDILLIDCRQSTWPQDMIIGGLSSDVCSFDTGHTNIEWN